MKKKKLRKRFLAKRDLLEQSEVSESNEEIVRQFISGFNLSSVRYLHHFLPIKGKIEVRADDLAKRIISHNSNIRIAVPRVNNRTGELEAVELRAGTEFEVTKWGIREPLGDELVDEKLLDLVIVPLLCFDRKGHRVGYGGGYYDRFLAKCRPDCMKAGVSFFEPVDEIEDIHEGDVRLDYCVTPEKVYDFSLTIDPFI